MLRIAVALACAALVVTAAPAQAAFTTWTSAGITPFQDAEGIAGDGQGNSYVVDNTQSKVYEFGPTGGLLNSFGSSGTGNGQFTSAGAVAVNPTTGDVFVGDNNRYERFNAAGVWQQNYAAASCLPLGISVTSAGNVYVACNALSNPDVRKFDSSGALQWSSLGEASSHFVTPADVAVGGSSVYVADSSAQRIVKLADSDGTFQSAFGAGQLDSPRGIAIKGDGDVVATSDTGSASRLVEFTSSGTFVRTFSGIGTEFPASATDVDIDSAAVYALGSQRVTRYDGVPFAAFTPTSATPRKSQTVGFDASASKLPLGTITKYEWDLDGDGSFETDTGATPTAQTIYATAGARDVHLRVTGSNSQTSTATQHIDVGGTPAGLTGPGRVLTGDAAALDASGSEVAGTTVLKYEWDLDGDGSFETDTGTNPHAAATFATAGDRQLAVRVSRAGGASDQAVVALSVRPKPPTQTVGVSIDNGAQFTNNPQVQITEVWPAFANAALISNDGGFAGAQPVPLSVGASWTLPSSGPERLPKTVYVRYLGAGDDTKTFSDDIILDQTPPTIAGARLISSVAGGTTTQPAASAYNTHIIGYHEQFHSGSGTATNLYRVDFDAGITSGAHPSIEFECRLDGAAWDACIGSHIHPDSMQVGLPVLLGSHTLEVRLVDYFGRVDPTPAVFSFSCPTTTTGLNACKVTRATSHAAAAASYAAASARKLKLRTYTLTLKASDKTSGVGRAQVAAVKSRPGRVLRFKSKLKVKLAAAPKFVRVIDKAGNASGWKRLRR